MFASDEDIGEAVLGYTRRKEFQGRATLLEADGMPKISPEWGGRFVPGVKAFLMRDYGMKAETPLKPDGEEGQWPTSKNARNHRASNTGAAATVHQFPTGSPAKGR